MGIIQIIMTNGTNTGRQVELDFVKGIAIIAMIICHTVGIMGEVHGHVGYIVSQEILGGPMAAPMFMICMGIGLSYSRRNTPLAIVKRGVSLLLLGYILNFARAGFPYAIGFALGMGELVSENLVYGLMIVDILQFAGLALVFIGICFKLQLKGWQMAAAAIVCSICGSLCCGFTSGNDALDALIGLFIGAGPMTEADCISAFPFSQWIIFPVFGVLAGRRLVQCTDKERLYRRVLAVTLPITLFYVWLICKNGFTPLSHNFYYWPNLAEGFFFICLDLLLISIGWQLCKVLPGWVMKPLEGLSRNITTVYFISWVIICWIGISIFWGLEVKPLNPWLAYLPGIVIIVVSYRLALLWNARKKV